MRCEKCGSLVDDDANYCDVCGKQLTRNKKGEIKKFLFVSDDLDNTQIINTDEVKPVRKAIKECDPSAFINVTKTVQIDGRFYQRPMD